MAEDIIMVIIRIIKNVLSTTYFFAPVDNKKGQPVKSTIGYLSLLIHVILIWPKSIWPYIEIESAFWRFLIKVAIIMIFLLLVKEGSIKIKLYYSCLLTIVHTNFTNIFMASPFANFRRGEFVFFTNPLLNKAFIYSTMTLVLLAIIWVIRRECDFREKEKYNRLFLGIYLFMSIVMIYMKQTMKLRIDIQDTFAPLSEYGIYYFALLVFIFVALIVMERFSREEEQRANLEKVITVQTYQYQALVEREKLETQLYCLQHDMKNHLLAIEKLADDNSKVREYVAGLRQNLNRTSILIKTGNRMIDGLMAEKLRWAGENDIDTNINMDLEPASFMKEIDLCTIVGNAMDNAIEASMGVDEKSKRRIHAKAGIVSNHLVFRFANYFEHELKHQGEQLETRKEDRNFHGFGLKSIGYALDKYKGSYTVEVDESHYFVLKIIIPLPLIEK